jgi:hypothetical protein
MSKQDRAIKLLKVLLDNLDLSDLPRGELDALHVMCWAVLANKPDAIAKVIEKFAFVEDSTDTDEEGQS